MAKILIIDDDRSFCRLLSREIGFRGHESTCAFDLGEGMRKVASEGFDAVFLDVRLPDGNGLEAIPEIRRTPTCPEVIIITGAGTTDGAELAIKNGVWDYIEKPSSLSTMVLPLIRALEYRDIKMTKQLRAALKLDGIMGRSARMKACYDVLSRAASVDAAILLTGETGTGKELFAQAIHHNSRRAGGDFVTVDCAALKETLAESILFGHEKGAFTGADRKRSGLIEQADGGTLFLDEIGELPLSLQRTFLRVLQERRFRPLGTTKEMESNFRLIAATNRNLDDMVGQGTFRRDLLFRLRSITIELPPLRERAEDIGEIAVYHIAKICKRFGTALKGFSAEFLESLCTYDWPGNIRELVNTLEMSVAAALSEPTLFSKHLPNAMRVVLVKNGFSGAPGGNAGPACITDKQRLPRLKDLRETALAKVEKQYLQELLAATGEDMKQACEISGLGRARLYQLISKYRVSCIESPTLSPPHTRV